MRNVLREKEATLAANFILKSCPALVNQEPPIGIILGTGWGDVLEINKLAEIPFETIPGFSHLESLEGHARQVVCGELNNRLVVVLRGRVHMNEAPSCPEVAKMVRLQVEMLCQLGVKTFIVTCAAGGLRGTFKVGEIAVVDGFVTVFAPEMPLWAGEFCSPEDVLSERLRQIALAQRGELITKEAAHIMLRGPFFEGRKYDKEILARTNAKVVGMSLLPEACVVALYEAEMLGLAFVTNDDIGVHSHETNVANAKNAASLLGGYLTRIVGKI